MNSITLKLITCSGCGAPVDPPQGSTFTTCSRCGSRLEIHRGGDSVNPVSKEGMRTQCSVQGHEPRLHSIAEELDLLDRAWEQEQRKYIKVSPQGEPMLPSRGATLTRMLVGSLFGLFWTAVTFSLIPTRSNHPGAFPHGPRSGPRAITFSDSPSFQIPDGIPQGFGPGPQNITYHFPANSSIPMTLRPQQSSGPANIIYLLPLLGLAMIALSLAAGVSSLSKIDRYQDAETLYRHKRQQLMQALEALR